MMNKLLLLLKLKLQLKLWKLFLISDTVFLLLLLDEKVEDRGKDEEKDPITFCFYLINDRLEQFNCFLCIELKNIPFCEFRS
jgi:hypothetical protein